MCVGLLFGLFATTRTGGFAVITSSALYGAILGTIFAVGAYAFTRGSHDYLSRAQLVPARYLLLADTAVAERACRALAGDTKPDTTTARTGPAEPAGIPGPKERGPAGQNG